MSHAEQLLQLQHCEGCQNESVVTQDGMIVVRQILKTGR